MFNAIVMLFRKCRRESTMAHAIHTFMDRTYTRREILCASTSILSTNTFASNGILMAKRLSYHQTHLCVGGALHEQPMQADPHTPREHAPCMQTNTHTHFTFAVHKPGRIRTRIHLSTDIVMCSGNHFTSTRTHTHTLVNTHIMCRGIRCTTTKYMQIVYPMWHVHVHLSSSRLSWILKDSVVRTLFIWWAWTSSCRGLAVSAPREWPLRALGSGALGSVLGAVALGTMRHCECVPAMRANWTHWWGPRECTVTRQTVSTVAYIACQQTLGMNNTSQERVPVPYYMCAQGDPLREKVQHSKARCRLHIT